MSERDVITEDEYERMFGALDLPRPAMGERDDLGTLREALDTYVADECPTPDQMEGYVDGWYEALARLQAVVDAARKMPKPLDDDMLNSEVFSTTVRQEDVQELADALARLDEDGRSSD